MSEQPKETSNLHSERSVWLSPVAKPWMIQFASALIPGYVDQGWIYEKMLKKNLRKSQIWIDAGCGSNDDILMESEVSSLSLGFDIQMKAQSRYMAANIYFIPLKDRSVDLISCSWVLEHLKHPTKALSEMERILKPGGHILIRTTNRFHYIPILSRHIPLIIKSKFIKREFFPTYYFLNDRWAFKRTLSKNQRLKLEEIICIENLHYGSPIGFVFSILTEWLLNKLHLWWLKLTIIMDILKT